MLTSPSFYHVIEAHIKEFVFGKIQQQFLSVNLKYGGGT